jgi:hypothetical protein
MRKASVISARCPLSSMKIPSPMLMIAPHKTLVTTKIFGSIKNIIDDAIAFSNHYEP